MQQSSGVPFRSPNRGPQAPDLLQRASQLLPGPAAGRWLCLRLPPGAANRLRPMLAAGAPHKPPGTAGPRSCQRPPPSFRSRNTAPQAQVTHWPFERSGAGSQGDPNLIGREERRRDLVEEAGRGRAGVESGGCGEVPGLKAGGAKQRTRG